jgi:hypothetical protein|tara:strand:+ start:2696 stop:3796 length:1101 start_codon:yes stop_codon:yes gene_type:complete
MITPQQADEQSRRSRSRSRLGSWLLVGLASVVAASASTVPAAAATDPVPNTEAGTIGLRLLDQPADTADDPRARIYIIDHLAPGTKIQRRIEVSTIGAPAQLYLYPAAATITNGSFLGEPDETPNDLSTWTSVTPNDIALTSNQVATATVTISVPNDAAPGEHYGVVWVQARTPTIDDRVVQINRVGIRLYLSIGSGGPPAADFEITSLAAGKSLDGIPTVVANVTNIGGRALDISGELYLRSTSGDLQAGPYSADLGATLAIGVTEPVTIAITTELPVVPWNAEITLRSGLVERLAIAELTFPATGVSPPVPATPIDAGSSSLPAFALALAAIALFTLLATFVIAIAAGRRRPAQRTVSSIPTEP